MNSGKMTDSDRKLTILGTLVRSAAGFAGFGPPIFYKLLQRLVLAGFIENSPFKPCKPSKRVFNVSQMTRVTAQENLSP